MKKVLFLSACLMAFISNIYADYPKGVVHNIDLAQALPVAVVSEGQVLFETGDYDCPLNIVNGVLNFSADCPIKIKFEHGAIEFGVTLRVSDPANLPHITCYVGSQNIPMPDECQSYPCSQGFGTVGPKIKHCAVSGSGNLDVYYARLPY